MRKASRLFSTMTPSVINPFFEVSYDRPSHPPGFLERTRLG